MIACRDGFGFPDTVVPFLQAISKLVVERLKGVFAEGLIQIHIGYHPKFHASSYKATQGFQFWSSLEEIAERWEAELGPF